ncbi:MAG: NADP-dependent oxidoreductase [Pseudomonadota bacterium]
MNKINRQLILQQRPSGRPTADIFSFRETPLEDPKDGEFLLKIHYISMDPALVSRLRPEQNYAAGIQPGDLMHAFCVAEVIESGCAQASTGQFRIGLFGMQEYVIADLASGGAVITIDGVSPSWYLGVLGNSGGTAYFALKEICQPRAGETLVISSAASSVGSIASQLAAATDCRIVGIVSTDDKARATLDRFPYDAVISYRNKSVQELAEELAAVCPEGVDCYFDNTSGDISEALLDLYNIGARIAVVGRMGLSHLQDTRQDIGRRDNNIILSRRIKKQGFLYGDYLHRLEEFQRALSAMLHSGELKADEDIIEGFNHLPEAFMRMVNGESRGKQLVKLS